MELWGRRKRRKRTFRNRRKSEGGKEGEEVERATPLEFSSFFMKTTRVLVHPFCSKEEVAEMRRKEKRRRRRGGEGGSWRRKERQFVAVAPTLACFVSLLFLTLSRLELSMPLSRNGERMSEPKEDRTVLTPQSITQAVRLAAETDSVALEPMGSTMANDDGFPFKRKTVQEVKG